VFPTVTRANATAIATGTYPDRNGIFGNTLYVREVNPTRAFGNDDDGVHTPMAMPVEDFRVYFVQIERDLGYQDGVGAAGNAGVQRDPARVAPCSTTARADDFRSL
jgi:hypothetical protein